MAIDRFRENAGIQKFPRNERQWVSWVNEMLRWIASQTAVDTAQTTADTAQTTAENSGQYTKGEPGNFIWNSDTSGVFPAGDPTRDLVLNFHDTEGTVIAVRTMRGTLTSSSGNIAITEVSTSGLTTTYSLVANNTMNSRADITLTNSDSSQTVGVLSWTSIDNSVAGGTPSGGGGK